MKHVEKWAKKTFPNAQFIDVEGIPVESWKAIAEEIEHILPKFPGMAERLERFGATDDAAHVIAKASPVAGSDLQFNRIHWQSLGELSKSLQQGVDAGYHPHGVAHAGAKYYVTHELGHLADGLISKTNFPVWRELVGQFAEAGQENNKYPARYDKAKMERVSAYGGTNEFEAWAESFAAARWRKDDLRANPAIKKFREILNP